MANFIRINESDLEIKPRKSCFICCQQAILLSLIGFGIAVFILIWTTPLPILLENWVSNFGSASSIVENRLFNLVEENNGVLQSLENFNQSLCTLSI